jgi:hypothetical protein
MTAPARYVVTHLEDEQLLERLRAIVGSSREIQAELLAHLAEVDARRLYRQAACASLFSYCVEILHFSEPTAYKRITAARAARRFPLIFELVAAGRLHLSAVCLLAPHLTPANHEALLGAAVHKTKRETDELVAGLCPRPAAPTLVRRLPEAVPAPPPRAAAGARPPVTGGAEEVAQRAPAAARAVALPLPVAAPAAPVAAPAAPAGTAPGAWPSSAAPLPTRSAAAVTPLGAERYQVQFTAPRSLRDKLAEAQDLLGRAGAGGDLAVVVERALEALLKELRQKKLGAAAAPRPRPAAPRHGRRTRHAPRATRRAVVARDGGRCAYVDPATGKRCSATTGLQFHHVAPWARGGSDDPSNVVLHCAAHNGLLAEQAYGPEAVTRGIARARAGGVRRRAAGGAGPERPAAGAPTGRRAANAGDGPPAPHAGRAVVETRKGAGRGALGAATRSGGSAAWPAVAGTEACGAGRGAEPGG